ncbi:hypothetical protein GCM10008933_35540 [Paenibacillus motobuensis]|uniref:Uncharacterized protein n=1 Tax=Paenibacillus motobuensis TaxID=295324 RepID=A0ABP3IFZ0_9BACL
MQGRGLIKKTFTAIGKGLFLLVLSHNNNTTLTNWGKKDGYWLAYGVWLGAHCSGSAGGTARGG